MMSSGQIELPYRVDPQRHGKKRATGVEVRAALPNGELVTVDIAELDRYSLQRWVRSRGSDNFLAHSVALLLVDHANTVPDMEGED